MPTLLFDACWRMACCAACLGKCSSLVIFLLISSFLCSCLLVVSCVHVLGISLLMLLLWSSGEEK